ncbi:ribosome biogenesis protein NOP53 [Scyliorhinus canicula]|uniref:ribosome biogenesis protein NOP53 n=1 Tax=Scyliorhinus canicula TaxID=7830 RepID=UPI0018F7307A|nr:ribosome biogenesis protein NOP53 [Scyliorhinus canicula]
MAAAPGPGFLALKAVPLSGSPPDPRRQRRRLNKNKKKNWNKHSDIAAVEEFLEDVRQQERVSGGLVSEKTDENLFFVDTGDETKDLLHNKGKVKPLRIDLILQSDSKVPVPKDILAYQIPNSRKVRKKAEREERLGIIPRKQRLLYARLRNPVAKKKVVPNNNPARDFYDLWSTASPLDKELEGKDTWFLEQTKKIRLKRPHKLNQKPSQLPAIEVIAPGGSYNPTFESHQALLLEAHQVEFKRQRAEEKIRRQVAFPPSEELPTKESVLGELCQGLLVDSDGEEQEGRPKADGEEAECGPVWNAVCRVKKTERERKKEKMIRKEKHRLKAQKAARQKQQDLFRLRSIKGEVNQLELKLEKRKVKRKAKQKAEANKPRRLGHLKYEDPDLEVKLSDELAGTLRVLKPEGSILSDRFKSLQKRNLIEARIRAKFKRKHKLKYVEKRAFREVTL